MRLLPFFACVAAFSAAFSLGCAAVRAETPGAAADPDPTAIDFSCVGYGGLGRTPPTVPTKASARPSVEGEDDTARLQLALDYLANLPAGEDGWRGALQLAPGKYRISGQLRLRASGVALRGAAGENGRRTVLVAAGQSRRTLIEIGAAEAEQTGPAIRIVDDTVPAGSRYLTLESTEGVNLGDRIVVTRPSPAEWIAALGMKGFKGSFADQRLDWPPGSRDLVWDRRVSSVGLDDKTIGLDAPITCALERRFGGGTIARVIANEPIERVGVENLDLECETDPANPRDEEHAWIGVALDHVENAWVRDVAARRFAGSAVRVGPRARRVSVEDCRSEQPVSEQGGYRRQSFLVEGQQTLVKNCTAENGMNDFAVGLCAAGPNVFSACTARKALGASGAFESWAAGVLYDGVKIEGAGLRLTRDMDRAQGGGWTAANSVIWNCQAEGIEARGPEGAPNIQRTEEGSLYARQLAKHPERRTLLPRPAEYVGPVKAFDEQPTSAPPVAASVESHPLEIVNGRFVVDGRALWGGQVNDGWWRGQANPAAALNDGVSITRFVPGRVGPGLTEDLPKLAAKLAADGTPFYQNGPGLWYDRRRDEHTILQRLDANVWAPFYEMPWARSGQGAAWDGLSRFDLTRYNPWYYARTREFAQLCEQRGLMLRHDLYNTHNVLEIGPHWVDYPWRPANCINETGLPEPPPYEPNNRLHVANQFYNVDDPKRRELHRAFILHELDELGSEKNVILGVAFQFAGPLAFQQFFQDTVAEWEQKTGRRARLALTTSKDITDAILADPARSKQIAVIDMRYWQYQPDGTLFAPPGGQNLAFREMIGKQFGKSADAAPPTSPEQIYRQVREYRDRFPDKTIVAWNGGAGPIPVLMAGGAQALMRNPSAGHGQGRQIDHTPLDGFARERLAPFLMNMAPRDGVLAAPARNWCLADAKTENALIYSLAGQTTIVLEQSLSGKAYEGTWFDPRTGKMTPLGAAAPAAWEKGASVSKPSAEDWLLLLRLRGN